MAKSERTRTDSRLGLFIFSLKEKDLDQVNQSEPPILGSFCPVFPSILFVHNHKHAFRVL